MLAELITPQATTSVACHAVIIETIVVAAVVTACESVN